MQLAILYSLAFSFITLAGVFSGVYAFTRKREISFTETFFHTLLFIMATFNGLYVVAWITNGELMQSTMILVITFASLMFPLIWMGWQDNRALMTDWRHEPRSWIKMHKDILIPLGVCLVMSLPTAIRMMSNPWPGDLGGNTLLINQMLNGIFPPDSIPFKEGPYKPYPALSFFIPAYLSRISGLSGSTALLSFIQISVFMVILSTWLFLQRFTKYRSVAFVGTGLAVLYSGIGTTSDLNITNWAWGSQIVQGDSLSRFCGFIALIVCLFYLCRFIEEGQRTKDAFGVGLSLGIMFSTHPYPSLIGVMVVTIAVIGCVWRKRSEWFSIPIIGFMTIVFGSPFLIGLVRRYLTPKDLDLCESLFFNAPQMPYGQSLLTFDMFILAYGILIPFAIFGVLFSYRSKHWWLIVAFIVTLTILFIYTAIREYLATNLGIFMPLNPMQHRLSFATQLFLGFLFVLALDRIVSWAKSFSGQLSIRCVDIVLASFAAMVIWSAFDYAIFSAKIMGNGGWFYQSTDSDHFAHKVLESGVDKHTVYSVPNELIPVFSYQTGAHILSMAAVPNSYSPCRNIANNIIHAPSEKREIIDKSTNQGYDQLFSKILAKYEISHLLMRSNNLDYAKSRSDLTEVSKGAYHNGVMYHIFQVDKHITSFEIDNELIEPGLFKAATGYYPVFARQAFPHRVSNMSARYTKGISISDNGFLILDAYQREILEINRHDGATLRTIKLSDEILSPSGLTYRDGNIEAMSQDGTIWRYNEVQDFFSKVLIFKDSTYRSLAWDGMHYLSVDIQTKQVRKLSPKTGQPVSDLKLFQHGHFAVTSRSNGDILATDHTGTRICSLNKQQIKKCYKTQSQFPIFYVTADLTDIYTAASGIINIAHITLDSLISD